MYVITLTFYLLYRKFISIAKLTRLNIGTEIGGETVSMIWFEDDKVVIAESDDDIQRTVNEMNERFKTSEMKINNTKTKMFLCARDLK